MKLKYKLGLYLTLLLGVMHTSEAQTYTVDTLESRLEWKGRKVTGSHNGILMIKSGELVIADGQLTGGNFEMDMTTIRVLDLSNRNMNEKLLNHLKSEDFFSVEEYPTSTFVITSATPGDANAYSITGDLSIKGTTAPVTFDATVDIADSNTTATATIKYDRTVYDIQYGSGSFFSNLGDNMINEEIELTVTLKAINK
ncbi:MAG: YceI family protein [Cyclobacteriaceae bacterium]